MSVTHSTFNGHPVLSIESATPTGLHMELRGARRRTVFMSLMQGEHVVMHINTVDLSQVMVGRITDQVHCLFIGHAAIDITSAAAAEINVWLGKQIARAIA